MPNQLAISHTYAEVVPAPILHLHRHQDGYIAFATERDGEDFRPLVSIRASELETWFPFFREQLAKDSFVGINADWRLRSFGQHGDSYGYPLHRSDRLRYINAAYVDIDHYRFGLSTGDVIGRVIDLQDSGQLPHASMIVKSGQGLWLLWLIRDPNVPEQSAPAFVDKLDLYCRIQESIIGRLAPLGADPAARDAARHIRVPGSIHTGSDAMVTWWVQGSGESGYVYTLQDLASKFNAAPTKRHGREIIAHQPRKRAGWVALHARRLRDFNTLRSLRGGFTLGCRNNAAKIYAWLLRCNGVGGSDLFGFVNDLAAQCHPRLSRAEIKSAVTYSKTIRRMRNQTISDWLNLTRKEAELMEKLPPAGLYRGGEDSALGPMPRELQREAIQARRAAIQAIIADTGNVPDVRRMARLIGAKGFRGNHQTVFKDYRALGIKWERTRQARAEAKTAQFPLLLTACKIGRQDPAAA